MNIHCIGIGGIGLSGLARLFQTEGNKVQGSDKNPSQLTDDLQEESIVFFDTHKSEHISPDIDWVIYSEAIPDDHIELVAAKEMNIRCSTYFEALGEWSQKKETLVVVGTHGKSTTTAMIANILTDADLDPSVVVGTKLQEFGNKNMRYGKSNLFVVEGCEYRESFLHLHPNYVVLLNCEVDHLDYYNNEDHYRESFRTFLEKIPADGWVVTNVSDPTLKQLTTGLNCQVHDTMIDEEDVEVGVPGEHNRYNAALAYSAGIMFDVDETSIDTSLQNFKGTWRRFEKKGEKNGALVIDDYGHHPNEVKATLQATKEAYPEKRIVCVFQPHQYSRTAEMLDEFSHAFADADIAIIADIYEARDTEEDKQKVSAETLVESIKEYQEEGLIAYGGNLENCAKMLNEIAAPTDVIVTMGAGDVWKVGDIFLEN